MAIKKYYICDTCDEPLVVGHFNETNVLKEHAKQFPDHTSFSEEIQKEEET